MGREGDPCWPTTTPSKLRLPLSSTDQQNGQQQLATVQRALKRYLRGEFDPIPWLDALSLKVAKDMVAAEERNARSDGTDQKESHLPPSSSSQLHLLVEVPSFSLPVLYQDSVAAISTGATAGGGGGGGGGAGGAGTPMAAAMVVEGTEDAMSTPLPGTSGSGVQPTTVTTTTTTTTTTQETASSGINSLLGRSLATGTGHMVLIHDPEVDRENPSEVKAQKMARSTGHRGLMDTGARPDTAEKASIDAVLAHPPGRPLTRNERELLWRFRFTLVSEGRALTRFLKCVDWSDAAEAAQAEELMGRWAAISVADALELLSPDYTVEVVRAHAVAALRPTSEEELLHFLLQLVQALRYEPSAKGSRLAAFLVDRAKPSVAIASALFWYLCAELDDPGFGVRAAEVQSMLLARTSPGSHVGSHVSMHAVPIDCIPLQLNLVARLRHLSDAVRDVRSAERKTEVMRGLLAPGGACADLQSFECPCPLDPSVRLLGIVPSECLVFKSKVSPMKITFRVALALASTTTTTPATTTTEGRTSHVEKSIETSDEDSGGGGAMGGRLAALQGTHAAADEAVPSPSAHTYSTNAGEGLATGLETTTAAQTTPSSPTPSSTTTTSTTTTTTLSLIYKRGDDLRQDQLVLQMISLMDRLLKREHLDLRITAYQVLPTSANDGLIEFVPASLPLSQVLRLHGSIHRFLSLRHPDPKGPYGLDPSVLANYVRSCAGYVVVTHVLGIGDRHMDNLMLTTDGRLFHIDFGYVLGRDPKFSTAPLVLNRAMVDGMGALDGPQYKQFIQLTGEAFNILRKSANLLLSLVHLMAGSSIPDIASDPEKALLKVQERLMLDLDDETAAAALEQMIMAAQSAVLPRVAEMSHRVAQGWR